MRLSASPDSEGVFRQWVNCASIDAQHPHASEAREMLEAYDRLWRVPTEYFPVPKTDGLLEIGMLKAHGYEVKTGAMNNEASRRHLLERIFERELAPLHSPDYRKSWGEPGSVARLDKMIAALRFQLSKRETYFNRNAVPRRRWDADKAWLEICRAELQTKV